MRPHAAKQTAKEKVAKPSCILGEFLEAMVLCVRLGFPAKLITETASEHQEREGASSYLLARVLTIRGDFCPRWELSESPIMGGEFRWNGDLCHGKMQNQPFNSQPLVLARARRDPLRQSSALAGPDNLPLAGARGCGRSIRGPCPVPRRGPDDSWASRSRRPVSKASRQYGPSAEALRSNAAALS